MNITTDHLLTTVNLRVYPTALIGNNFTGCKILAIMDADSAGKTGLINPPAMHSQVYPTLPAENLTPNDYEAYMYVKIQLMDGSYTVIGDPWIVPSSITDTGTGTITMIWEDMIPANLEEIKRIVQKNGFPSSTSKFE